MCILEVLISSFSYSQYCLALLFIIIIIIIIILKDKFYLSFWKL